MTIDAARLRALAEAAAQTWSAEESAEPGCEKSIARAVHAIALRDLQDAASPDAILAILDERDALVRERDDIRSDMQAYARQVVSVVDERDALAADARRWRAIETYWRTAQCYFRKDKANNIRAMQLFIDFDHPNGGKSLASTIDAALDGAKGE